MGDDASVSSNSSNENSFFLETILHNLVSDSDDFLFDLLVIQDDLHSDVEL
jgi:hypothetical protein